MAAGKSFTFRSDIDGLELSALQIEPECEVKGVVQLVHGMCEYKERYLEFMNFLADNGYLCVIHDHRGHGASVKSPDDLGYFYQGGWNALIEDTKKLMLMTKEGGIYKEGMPYILLGHSMGSFVVRCFIRKYDDLIDKLLVVGSPSQVPGAGFGLLLTKVLTALKGEKSHSKLLDTIVMDSAYEKRYKSENLKHAWVCSDKEVVYKYNQDPLCAYTFTIQGYTQLLNLMKTTYGKDGWAVKNPDLPVKFFSGEGDPCAVSDEAFKKAVDFIRRCGYKNVDSKMYPDMRHEILNEPERAGVYQDMLDFIEA